MTIDTQLDAVKQFFAAHIKKFLTANRGLSKTQFLLILLFSTVLFLSLGWRGQQVNVYKLSIGPAPNSHGLVKVFLHGNKYDDYLAAGALQVPSSGWQVSTLNNFTILTAEQNAPPLLVYSEGNPVTLGLLHYEGGGVVSLTDGNNVTQFKLLQSGTEKVAGLTVGGMSSNIPQSGFTVKHTSPFLLVVVFLSILALFYLIARMQLRQSAIRPVQPEVGWDEVAYFALPLLLSTTVVLLSYWPGSVTYDGSLQWHQAVSRGQLNPAIGITTTLFMRLFAYISESPAWVIVFQSVLSAAGVAFILKEFRYRGVPRWAAQLCAIALAILPQYPTFFTTLGKDALSAVGIIWLAWSVLSIMRINQAGRLNHLSLVILITSAVFAAAMRINAMPVAALVILAITGYLYSHGRRVIAIAYGAMFIVAVISVPKIALSLSDEQNSMSEAQKLQSSKSELPLGFFANHYIWHFFAAAVHSGLPLNPSDTELFYRIAPRSAWARYACYMTDQTGISITEGMLLTGGEYAKLLRERQLDLASAVLRIIRDNPSILFDRQRCITEMLWYTGYGQKPFQTTAALGYSGVTDEFKLIAGENKSLLPEKIRAVLQKCQSWTELPPNFWFFWRPALMFYLGLFCVLFRLSVQRDNGLLFMLAIPLSLTVVMAILIPFPAYRYQYPATLLMMMLCTLSFSTSNIRKAIS